MAASLRGARRAAVALSCLTAPVPLAAQPVSPTGELATPATATATPARLNLGLPPTPGLGAYGVSAFSPEPLLSPTPYHVERPGSEPGWFADVAVGLVKPRVTNRVTSETPIGPGLAGPATVPTARLDFTASPRFELGYRLDGGAGDLRLSYRLLASTGTEVGPGSELRTRLDLNVIDFEYASPEWLTENPGGLFRDLRYTVGARLATAYLDSAARGGAVADDRFASHFIGAGPKVGLEYRRPMAAVPLEWYAKLEASGLFGTTRQDFAFAARDAAGAVVGAARRGGEVGNGAAALGGEFGVAWRPDPRRPVRVVAGYQFEQWYNLGRTGDSNFELFLQGAFLRAEWRY